MKPSILVMMLLMTGASHHALAQAASAGSLRVGAAKVDVTPSQGELPKNMRGILDHLYARAIVLENGTASAALISPRAPAGDSPIRSEVSRFSTI